jgi:arylsulfatase A-like enzyme
LSRLSVTMLLIVVACSSPPVDSTVPLVDVFGAAQVENVVPVRSPSPLEWRFEDPEHGFKAGPGVTGLRVVEGRLTGRATNDVPIVHVERTIGIEDPDTLHAVELRLRASKGANFSMQFVGTETVNLETSTSMARRGFWQVASPLIVSDEPQTYTVAVTRSVPSKEVRHILLRPSDESGAEFEIEYLRLIFRKEHLASIPSGVSWQGLSEIYRETVVSRAGETLRFQLTLPENPWLDLAVGTVDAAPVRFRVAVRPSGEEETALLERTVADPYRWESAPVDLEEYAGQNVTLSLLLQSDSEGALGFWGSPVVRSRGGGAAEPDAPRGVIVVLIDSLRRDHLETYAYARETAPNLRRMADEGALFLDNQAQADFTKVSVPSILSSLYPSTQRIAEISDRLPSAAVTLAEVYRENGYATWASAANGFTGRMTNLHQGVEELHEPGSVELPEGWSRSKNGRSFVDRFLPWLELHRDTPFFAFLHVLDPHPPFEPYAPYDTSWADPAWKTEHLQDIEQVRPFIAPGVRRGLAMATRAELERAGIDPARFVEREIDWYDGSIQGVDAEIGRVFEKLRELGIEEDTVVAFVSDHGEEFLDHGMHFNANSLYGEMTNVPLILWGPQRVPAGRVVEETVQSIDLAPTLLELSRLPVPETMQGQSLSPLLEDGGRWRRRPAISERNRSEAFRDLETANSTAIVWDGWKLIRNRERPEGRPEIELFDHRKDPLCLVNVAEQHPEKVAELSELLEGWRLWVKDRRLPTDAELTQGVSGEELERLRSLGYVQ